MMEGGRPHGELPSEGDPPSTSELLGEDDVGSKVETDPREIAAMARFGLVIRESEVEVLANSHAALHRALEQIVVEFVNSEARRRWNESQNYLAAYMAELARDALKALAQASTEGEAS